MVRWNLLKKGVIWALVACLTLGSSAMAQQTQQVEKPEYEEATEETQEKLKELFSANAVKKILQGRSSLRQRMVLYKDGKSIGKYYNYGDPDKFIMEDTTGQSLLVEPTLYLTAEDGEMLEYLLGEKDYEQEFWDCFSYFSLRRATGEEAVAFTQDEENYYFVAETDAGEAVRGYMDLVNEFQADAYTYEEGQGLRFYMIFDRDDDKLLRQEIYLLDTDDSEKLMIREGHTYDQVIDIEDTLFASYFQGETREFALVTSPGTEAETVMGYTVPWGVAFDINIEGEFPEVYTDEACTKPLKFKDTAQMDGCYLYIKGDGWGHQFGL